MEISRTTGDPGIVGTGEMRVIRVIISVILFALIQGHEGLTDTSYPLTVRDCRGKTITIVREPKRIVSLSPNNTEILFALGLEKQVVGVTKYCNYPPAARRKPKVGDRRISIEAVISLHPDLVLAHGFLNDEAIKALEKHKIKTFAIDPKTIDQVCRDILTIGRITNRYAQAEKISARIKSVTHLVRARTSSIRHKPTILVAIQADPLWAAGPDTFIDEIIRIAGGKNIAHDAKPGFNLFSMEAAAARNPEVIITVKKGDEDVFARGLWRNTAAARNKRIYEVDPDLLCRPGPRLADGILAIAKVLHPTKF